MQTLYGDIEPGLYEKLKHIRLLVCDVDGVFSDGRIYLSNAGEELKAFHTKDGYGIKALINERITVAIITGRDSKIVSNRFKNLGVQHIIQGTTAKFDALQTLQQKIGISPAQTCAIGDDLPDTGMFALSSIAAAPSDAHPSVLSQASYTTTLPGGFGCVREMCDLILLSQHKLQGIKAASI